MAAPTLIIKTAITEPITEIKDLGFKVPGGGSPVITLNDESAILEAAESDDLRVLVAAGTLILNDGTSDLSASNAEPWLDSLATPSSSGFAVILAGGTRPFTAPVAGVAPTAPAHLATRQWVEDQISGGGITGPQHEVLDTLIHEIAENSHLEITRSAGKISNATWWTDSGKTTKIREVIITRSSGKIASVVTKQYDGAGVLIVGQTLTETITRSGGKIASVAGVET